MLPRHRDLTFIVVLLLFGSFLTYGSFVLLTNDTEYTYEYTVKSEQIEPDKVIDSYQSYDTLTEDEKQLIKKSFEESDDFFGDSKITVNTDEKLQFRNDLKFVKLEGVILFASIQGPEKSTKPKEAIESTAIFFSTLLILLMIKLLYDSVSKYREKYII